VFAALQYHGTTKYMVETGQSYIYSAAFLSKRWFDALPADLQSAIMTTAKQVEGEAIPWAFEFLAAQRKAWVEKGAEIINLSAAEKAELMQKMSTVARHRQDKAELKPLWISCSPRPSGEGL